VRQAPELVRHLAKLAAIRSALKAQVHAVPAKGGVPIVAGATQAASPGQTTRRARTVSGDERWHASRYSINGWSIRTIVVGRTTPVACAW
jgi:hypothetical protein